MDFRLRVRTLFSVGYLAPQVGLEPTTLRLTATFNRFPPLFHFDLYYPYFKHLRAIRGNSFYLHFLAFSIQSPHNFPHSESVRPTGQHRTISQIKTPRHGWALQPPGSAAVRGFGGWPRPALNRPRKIAYFNLKRIIGVSSISVILVTTISTDILNSADRRLSIANFSAKRDARRQGLCEPEIHSSARFSWRCLPVLTLRGELTA